MSAMPRCPDTQLLVPDLELVRVSFGRRGLLNSTASPTIVCLGQHLDDDVDAGLLLFGLVEDVDGPAGLVSCVGHVEPSPTLVLIRVLLDSLQVLLIQLDLLEVLSNTRGGDRLGDDGVSTDLAPCQDDLGGGGTLLLGDGLDLRAGDDEGEVERVVTECRVGGDVDVLLLGVLDELLAGEDGVALDLVDGGDNAGLVNQLLERSVCEVGHTNGANLALGELAHSLPCLTVGDRAVDVDLVGVRGGGE